MATIATLMVLVCACGLLLAWAERRYRADSNTLIDAIDALLPQTQCGQCGYPGCRPYAAAVAGGAASNLCPPGGPDTQRALERLLGHAGPEPIEPVAAVVPGVAVIDEQQCIGCFLCAQACPVDAIVGAPQFMHTVLESVCTGCGLCLPPCPVDCIELVTIPTAAPKPRPGRRRWPDQASLPCIRCGKCEDVCPAGLQPQEMLWFERDAIGTHAITAGQLARCIECGLCNQVCPSNIDLLSQFQSGRQQLVLQERAELEAARARQRYAEHQTRLAARSADRRERRSERIAGRTRRTWQS